MTSANVVGIHGVKAPGSSGARPLPKVVLKLRDHSKDAVRALLIELFNNADDALFAMADKAGTNGEQAIYFEAMRELRLKKRNIVLATLGAAVRSFNDVGQNGNAKSEQGARTDADDLSLVDDEKLEYDVAVEAMVQRLRGKANNALDPLVQRLKHVYQLENAENSVMPLSPEILCNGFVEGCAELESDIKAKLVVFKLFERFVLTEMPKVYDDLNAILIAENVLPTIKRSVKRSAGAPNNSAASSTGGASSDEANSEQSALVTGHADDGSATVSLDALRQLLHPQGAVQVASSVNVSPIPRQDIVNTLSLFQSNGQDAINDYVSVNQAIDFNALLNARLGGDTTGKACNDVDSDLINLVSMLFEFILEDRQLHAEMRATISRLQIPILKVALLDKNFFNKGGHPARKLLNEIASAAIGWNPSKGDRKDRFKNKLEAIVDTITQDFTDDVQMFSALLAEFQDFVDSERKRGLLVEQRTRDSEKGRAASDDAKRAAQSIINKALEDHAVPDLGLELLRDGWSHVLVFHFLREGEDSKKWAECVSIVDDLVWSLCPDPNEPEARAKLLKLIPMLVKRLREGFKEVSFDDQKTKAFLTGLKDQHVLSLQALQQQIDLQATAVSLLDDEKSTGCLLDAASDQNDEVSALVASTLELEDDFKRLHEACGTADREAVGVESKVDETQSSKSEVDAPAAKLPKQQESIVLVEEQVDEADGSISDDSPFMQQVDRFVVGCWFEFAIDGKNERCKLAAIIKSTGKHIFVNRSGVKVFEKNRQELAKHLSSGSVQALNDGLLFDRALESIITNLRS